MNRFVSVLAFCLIAVVAPSDTWAISVGQVDSFTTAGDTQGWTNGGGFPTQNTDPGFDGALGHLENDSSGSGGGGKQLFWNDLQWTGNYLTAGVNQISLFADNRSGNGQQIDLRLAFLGGNDWFVTDAVILADGSGWTPITYDIGPGGLTLAGGFGSGNATTTLSNVVRVEILSESGAPFSIGGGGGVLRGDEIVSDLRVDEITALGPGGGPGVFGDYNGNGIVDQADHITWKSEYGLTGAGLASDGNQDFTVDELDYLVWLNLLGKIPEFGASNFIPEPSSLTLVLISALSAGRLWRKT